MSGKADATYGPLTCGRLFSTWTSDEMGLEKPCNITSAHSPRKHCDVYGIAGPISEVSIGGGVLDQQASSVYIDSLRYSYATRKTFEATNAMDRVLVV